MGKDDTDQGARHTRRDRLAGWQSKEYRQWERHRGRGESNEAAGRGLDSPQYQEYILLSNELIQRTPCRCTLTDEVISHIDDLLIDQLGAENINITDASTEWQLSRTAKLYRAGQVSFLV